MSIRSSPWPAGTPCWVDVAAVDPGDTSAFYSELLGWEVRPGQSAAGDYRMALLRGAAVAGIRAPLAGEPVSWTAYVAMTDIRATLREVVAAGGRVNAGPMSLLAEGAIALAEDPAGVRFGVWEAGRLVGAELVNEAGGFCWAELLSREPSISRSFGARVFGHAYSDRGGDGFRYAMIRVGDVAVAGLASIGPARPGEAPTPAQWLVYFSVNDTVEVSDHVLELGGRVHVRSTETPHGRMALLQGRGGELFGVLEADDLPRPAQTPSTI